MLPMFARCNHSTSIFMEALLFKAYPNVESSTYSISEPDGSPRANLVISMSMLDNESRMKEAVASPNNVGFVAIINSLILFLVILSINSEIFKSSGPIPWTGDITPCNT